MMNQFRKIKMNLKSKPKYSCSEKKGEKIQLFKQMISMKRKSSSILL